MNKPKNELGWQGYTPHDPTTEGARFMRMPLYLLPLVLLGLAGCVHVNEQPTPKETVVTPPPASPPTVYTAPGSTVITRP